MFFIHLKTPSAYIKYISSHNPLKSYRPSKQLKRIWESRGDGVGHLQGNLLALPAPTVS